MNIASIIGSELKEGLMELSTMAWETSRDLTELGIKSRE